MMMMMLRGKGASDLKLWPLVVVVWCSIGEGERHVYIDERATAPSFIPRRSHPSQPVGGVDLELDCLKSTVLIGFREICTIPYQIPETRDQRPDYQIPDYQKF